MNNKAYKVPNHLAIILDGNGRWASSRGLIRSFGHKQGVESLIKIIDACYELKVYILSLFCFSTENWKRDKKEIDFLFTLLTLYLNKYENALMKKDIKVIFSGKIEELPYKTYTTLKKIADKTKYCKKFILNICINYGGQDEMLYVCKQVARKVKYENLSIETISKKTIESLLYTKGLDMVDLLIRTSNELRISNFMLWQISYAELYFSKKLWPDFTKEDLLEAFEEYAKRKRRYGGIDS